MAEKFVLFDDAAKELKTSADGLKKLMEEGKIRHFMDSGKIKFRQKDVDDLKVSLGIKSEDDELSLAPPEDVLPMPPVAGADADDIPVPPAAKEEEFSIEPLDEGPAPSTFGSTPAKKKGEPAVVKAAVEPQAPAEDEVASLSDLEASSEEGQELTGEEAELLAMQGGLRGAEESGGGGVGMTVLLVAATVIVALSVAFLLSFPLGINPFESLTNYFSAQ